MTSLTFWEITAWGALALWALSTGAMLALWYRADRKHAARESKLYVALKGQEYISAERADELVRLRMENEALTSSLYSAKRVQHATDCLTTLGKIFHARSVEAGFWESFEHYSGKTTRTGAVNRAQREWIGLQLALIGSEIGEATEALRDGKIALYLKEGKPEGLGVELIDAVIRILDLLDGLGLNAGEIAQAKHAYNCTRPRLHGRSC